MRMPIGHHTWANPLVDLLDDGHHSTNAGLLKPSAAYGRSPNVSTGSDAPLFPLTGDTVLVQTRFRRVLATLVTPHLREVRAVHNLLAALFA